MSKKKIAFVLGIRPDIIRASLIMKYLKQEKSIETTFIWSGQHYSDNLKGIFFRELDMVNSDIELNCKGDTDAQLVSSIISNLYPVLEKINPDVVVYLGDTNTVASCLAAAQLNIPIVHIEGCMRSYDWRMPEEKYRTTIDHLSDLIYTYFDEYKKQGVNEGLNPQNIVVVGNPIVDILNQYYFNNKDYFDKLADKDFFSSKNIKKKQYYLMTCHRRENVHNQRSFQAILNLIADSDLPIYFPASYRTQKIIKDDKYKIPENVIMVDPIGYNEFLTLFVNSKAILTDSGTEVEEASILGIPSVQMRMSTERPQVYDTKSSVKFDPTKPEEYPSSLIFAKLRKISNSSWKHNLGDGKTSQRIAKDLIRRINNNQIKGHLKENYHISVDRSYREDGITV